MNEDRWAAGQRLDKMEEIIGGAVNSIAALTEQSQARMPFYVDTHAQQNFEVSTGQVVSITPQSMAQQLVRVTGLMAIVQGSASNVLGPASLQLGDLLLPLVNTSAASVFGLALVLPICSKMLDSQSQRLLTLSATAAYGGVIQLFLWVWGEQVPTMGMVS